jgi:hypothetical protein
MEHLDIPIQAIEDANRKLDRMLDTLRPAQASPPMTAQHMADVLAEVLRVGEWLRPDLAPPAEGRVAEELGRYRQRLEQLRDLLPGVHAQLLIQRSRLEAERTHLEAAASWARSFGKQMG